MNIEDIQQYMQRHSLDGWLMADFHGRNEVAMEFVRPQGMITRRSFFLIPASGEPVAIVHAIEQDKFEHLPGRMVQFSGYKQLERILAEQLNGLKKIAMEYSPMGRLPYIGLVEAGTIELVRGMGIEVVSSADLVADFQARLNDKQILLHKKAALLLIEIMSQAHELIAGKVQSGDALTEYDVVRFLMKRFSEEGLFTDYEPNCSVDGNAGNPHYQPTAENTAMIKKGQLVLIDMWARHDTPDGIYGDITWMAYTGSAGDIPPEYIRIFDVLIHARDRAVSFLAESIGHRDVYGAEVDDACREVIENAGYGSQFTHRTGHSIATVVHGPGPNIDNLETEDKRILQAGHLFSIEPGIYSHEYGFRTEIDCLITPSGPEVTTLPLQTEIKPLL